MGDFSVASARSFIDEKMLLVVNSPTRWCKEVPIEINIFVWRLSLDRLPNRVVLDRRGIDLPCLFFPLYEDVHESSSHLFFDCSLLISIIFQFCHWWGFLAPGLSSYANWLFWFKALHFQALTKRGLEGVIYVAWWIIWDFRNFFIFGGSNRRRPLFL